MCTSVFRLWASQVVLAVKNLPASAGDLRDTSSIPGSGRSPGGGHGNSLQYSCLENPMDRGAWQAKSIGLWRIRQDWNNLACTLQNITSSRSGRDNFFPSVILVVNGTVQKACRMTEESPPLWEDGNSSVVSERWSPKLTTVWSPAEM